MGEPDKKVWLPHYWGLGGFWIVSEPPDARYPLEHDEPPEPVKASREAAVRREAALQRTAKWRNPNEVWPPPPTGQETPRRVKQVQPPPDRLEQVCICVSQFIGGLVPSYFTVGVSYILMSPFIPQHVPRFEPQASEMPAELLEMAFTLVLLTAMTAVFFRKSKVFGLSIAVGGLLYMAFSLAFLGI